MTDSQAKIDLKNGILAVVQEIVGTDRMPVLDERLDFITDLGVDSLEMLEIVMLSEELAGVVLPEEYFEGLTTIADLLDWLKKMRENR